jgi:acetyl esterase/lipase
MMVPTGIAAPCTGQRPIVLYAHGTSTVKSFNLAAVGDPTNDAYSESALIGAMFAAQGYIVVAPNYAGYDTSTLPYHPYLNADQQSKDMIDALTAARSALGHIFASGTTDSGNLFITGYSQGGHVAMATHKAMETLYLSDPVTYAKMKVTASAPMSGPYAMEAFGDAMFFGNVDIGGTLFAPMLATSYQKEYGNIYTNTTDIFKSPYATGIDTLLPSMTPYTTLFTNNILPQSALFDSLAPSSTTGISAVDNAVNGIFAVSNSPSSPFAFGFDSANYLINNSYRLAYVQDAVENADDVLATSPTTLALAASPANTLRQAFKANDLRNFTPSAPVLLCGGHNDPTVFYKVNAGTVATLSTANPYVSTIDVDGAGTIHYGSPLSTSPNGGLAALETGLQQQFSIALTSATSQAITAYGAEGLTGAALTTAVTSAVAQSYHGTLVPPFCTKAAQQFFLSF